MLFHRITIEQYREWRGAVPPTHTGWGRFLSGEPYNHTEQGFPRYQAFFMDDAGQAWASNQPMTFSEYRAAGPDCRGWTKED